jgi:3-methyladenine DNA glycosylase AlkD
VEAEALADRIEARLREVGTEHRATGEKAYLKSDLEFVGATVRDTREIIRALVERPDRAELLALVEALWASPIHERRSAAVLLLARHARLLRTEDLPLLERLARASRTWALLDYLAVDALGPMVEADPAGTSAILDRWASDPDFWVRRASLLAELRPIRNGVEGALDRFLLRADAMLDEREFFIRKAIGWVLREAGKRQPGAVAAWVAPRTHRASGVTMREAVKHLAAADAQRLMDAYRRKVPGD